MSSEFQIRPAQASDLAAITRIYAHHVLHGTATFELDPPLEAEVLRRWKSLTDKGFPYLVAESDGAAIGYAYAGQYRPRIGYRFTVEDSVYIHPDHLGQGAGRALLVELLTACRSRGYRQMIAVIGDSANAASIRLHERLGFRHAGTLHAAGYKFERWIDTVLMQLALEPDPEAEV